MGVSAGYLSFKLAQEISPIILTGGIATSIGGTMPIVLLTETTAGLLSQAISGGLPNVSLNPETGLEDVDAQLDAFFAHFVAMPGSSLIANTVSTYPFANQQVAANAIIAQPLNISLRMICPARGELGYPLKLATMMSLRQSLYKHNTLGGLYSVVTPSYIYTNCILTALRDVSAGETKQSQSIYQWDFTQPLVTQQQATTALNGLLSSFSNGTPFQSSAAGAGGLSIGSPTNAIVQAVAPGLLQ
jgi:hypothetical protein